MEDPDAKCPVPSEGPGFHPITSSAGPFSLSTALGKSGGLEPHVPQFSAQQEISIR